ncbi:MAG: hypothetical protein U0R68_18225 [Candidatus Nanopelagicales bacterium]
MTQQVVPLDLGVMWEPNAPDAVLVSTDSGRAALALIAHASDEDRRAVVLVWSGCAAALMAPPNDEARIQHRLYNSGLRDLLWVGVVEGSEWAAAVDAMRAGSSVSHFVVLTKESTVEVLADALSVVRVPGSTAEAALGSDRT